MSTGVSLPFYLSSSSCPVDLQPPHPAHVCEFAVAYTLVASTFKLLLFVISALYCIDPNRIKCSPFFNFQLLNPAKNQTKPNEVLQKQS